jgi:hypothetical protein
MPTTVFSTDVLLGVVEGLKTPNPALLERYFPHDPAERSGADPLRHHQEPPAHRALRLAARGGQGRGVAGLEGQHLQPRLHQGQAALRTPTSRSSGSPASRSGGRLTPQQRLDAYLATELDDQVNMVTRRLEVMASEALRTAKVTVTGEGYGTVVVDFGRDPALTPAALAGTDKWTDPGSHAARRPAGLVGPGAREVGHHAGGRGHGRGCVEGVSDARHGRQAARRAPDPEQRHGRGRAADRGAHPRAAPSTGSTSGPTAAGTRTRTPVW